MIFLFGTIFSLFPIDFFWEDPEILAENIPGAKLLLIDNAAHVYFLPDSDKVFNSTLEFLKAPVDKVIEKVV